VVGRVCLLIGWFVRSLTPDHWPEVGQAHVYWRTGRTSGQCAAVIIVVRTTMARHLAEVALYEHFISCIIIFVKSVQLILR